MDFGNIDKAESQTPEGDAEQEVIEETQNFQDTQNMDFGNIDKAESQTPEGDAEQEVIAKSTEMAQEKQKSCLKMRDLNLLKTHKMRTLHQKLDLTNWLKHRKMTRCWVVMMECQKMTMVTLMTGYWIPLNS